ncbi:Heterokaryon incompatibility protein 6,OR allele [Lachnellula cervina]|uniref:Heterokaryon incompatibility protein 6,OR allele n=1 Tax=Lachnellula cervina TaxID=1316786 RepID=A0A7D8UPY4_9HELO|nr:Heterokaryon incompatibility protein 6,OR allele [Lachnellula cervina]
MAESTSNSKEPPSRQPRSSQYSTMTSAVVPSPRSPQSINIAESTSHSEEPPAKRIRSSRSVASATGCATVQPTVYRHLDKTKREIRICDLYSSSELSAPLICSLRIVPLDKVGEFVAFSYVWGQEPATEAITINGFQHQIRSNLAAGLRRFRANHYQSMSGKLRKPRPISVWVDAICINQDSIEERNHQVPLMRLIFSECEYAFSWLGESDGTSDLAMDSIARLETFECMQARGLKNVHVPLTQKGSPFREAAPWIAIRKLLEREFWHRIWIFQELRLPKKRILACGSKSIPWKTFKVLNQLCIGLIDKYKFLRRELAYLDHETQDEVVAVCRLAQSFVQILACRSYPKSERFGELVVYTTHLKATDARDKIYGLLAIAENPTILPDYSKTVNQVYTEFAKSMLDDIWNLPLLLYCGLSTNEDNTKLATWVPNWDHITRTETSAAARWGRWLDPGSARGNCLKHLAHLEFRDLPHLTAFHVRGQLRSSITGLKYQNEWLELHNYKSTISNIYGSLYPCWSERATDWEGVRQPVQRLVALYLTLTQNYSSLDDLYGFSIDEEKENTAAGFCYTTISRLDSETDTTDTVSKLSLSMLLETVGSEFKNLPEAFSHPEQYENDYLMAENDSLHRRVFFETSSGRFGLGPIGAQEGDIICNIYGFAIPLLLRKVDSHYLIVGSCFVLGCMADQGYDESKAEILEIW